MNLGEIIDGLRKRVYDLERNQARGAEVNVVVGSGVMMGIPTSMQKTNPCSIRSFCTLQEVTIELDAAAASDVTIDVLRTGVSAGSATVSTGNTEGTGVIGQAFSRADTLQLQATTPGSGYTSGTIHLRFENTGEIWHPPVLLFTPPTAGGTGDYTVTWPLSGTVSLNVGSAAADLFTVPSGGGGTLASIEYIASSGGGGVLWFKKNGAFLDSSGTLVGAVDVTHTSTDYGAITLADGDTINPLVEPGQDTFFMSGAMVVATITGAASPPAAQFVNWTP